MKEEEATYLAIRKNKKGGIELLYNRYGRRLYGYGMQSWHLDEDDAWDLIYKTLYKVVDTIDNYEFETEQKFGAFVFTVFTNNLRMLYRDQKRLREHIEFTAAGDEMANVPEAKGVPADAGGGGERLPMAMLKEELESLEDWERVLLLLRIQDMPYSEIAKHVGKPAEQLKVYYQRLKEKLTKKVHERMTALKQS